MTYAVSDRVTENVGSMHYEKVTLDITSLANAGNEPVGATDETRLIEDAVEVRIAGQENGGYQVTYDHINDQIDAKYADYDAAADGVLIDVPAATDVGEVELVVVGF